jgi:hypothetical protein
MLLTGVYRHVVLKAKELRVLSPHGQRIFVEQPDRYTLEVPIAAMLERLTGGTNELLVCLR